MRPIMRSFVWSGTAIMVCTFCSTMLIRPLKASSSCASRTRMDFFSLMTRSRTAVLMRKPSPLCARGTSVSPSSSRRTPRWALTAWMARSRITWKSSESGRFSESSWPARMSACMAACMAEVLGPPRSMAMVWLESAPSRLVTTVEVVGELASPPSKTTTPLSGASASGENTMTRWPAVMRSPGFRMSRAFSGMLLTKVPFLLPRSCTVQSSACDSKAKCWRERPASSGKHSSAALDRPTDRRSPVSGIVFIWPSGHWMSSSRDMRVLCVCGGSKPLYSGRPDQRLLVSPPCHRSLPRPPASEASPAPAPSTLFRRRAIHGPLQQHALVNSSRGTLRSDLLGAALGLAGDVFAYPDLHCEGLGVLRTLLLYDRVARLRQSVGLRQFLERALEIRDGRLNVRSRFLIAGKRRVQDVRGHETLGRFQAPVQVNRRDYRFQSVYQQRFLRPAAAHFLAASQFQIASQIQPPGNAMQVGSAHQVSLQA